MLRLPSSILLPLSCIALITLSGCSDQPTPPVKFKLEPQAAAQEAIRLYDANRDGTLDAKELEKSPPLKELRDNLKYNNPSHGDSLSAQDISTRLQQWIDGPAILQESSANVSLDGKPLEGATVTFEPEAFLGESYHSHQAQTDSSGRATLDPELKGYPGIYVGLYRVRVSKVVNGKETIPARYNTETTLGLEVATNVRNSRESGSFSLKSR